MTSILLFFTAEWEFCSTIEVFHETFIHIYDECRYRVMMYSEFLSVDHRQTLKLSAAKSFQFQFIYLKRGKKFVLSSKN